MFLDFDGSVFWIYDNEKNERYTKMMQDYMENHTESEVAEYAISLGIDPSIILVIAPVDLKRRLLQTWTAFDEAQEWYYDLKVKLERSYAHRTYRDQTTYRYDSWSNTVISEDQRIYNAMKPVEVEFNEYFMLEPGWYYTYYTDEKVICGNFGMVFRSLMMVSMWQFIRLQKISTRKFIKEITCLQLLVSHDQRLTGLRNIMLATLLQL